MINHFSIDLQKIELHFVSLSLHYRIVYMTFYFAARNIRRGGSGGK